MGFIYMLLYIIVEIGSRAFSKEEVLFFMCCRIVQAMYKELMS